MVDEALADYVESSLSELIKKNDNIIVVRSFSKLFGLASLRIGYLVASKNIINLIRKISSPFSVNGIAQELAIEALQDKEHIKESINYVNAEKEILIKELEEIGFQCTKSSTTNFLVNIEQLGNPKQAVTKLLDKGILVTEASFFKVLENKYIRISVSLREENKYFIKVMRELALNHT